MKYECGLRFTGIIFEDMETAQKWLANKNPNAYELQPVAFHTKNGEIK
mgnify:FL=1